MLGMQRALSLIYPDQCVLCPELVETAGGLCASCWRDVAFLRGLVCDSCGVSLPGDDDGSPVYCDDCLATSRPWEKGRAVFSYRGAGRRLVLALKHGDRPDLAVPAAAWLEHAGRPVLRSEALIVPVPIHWTRLLKRRYNQSVELGRALSRKTDLDFCPDALVRVRRTPIQDGLGVEQRFANVVDAIEPHPKRLDRLKGRDVCLVDDVMTSGATLGVATEACLDAGARRVSVLVLARVEKAS
jgi:predicted amidophosphoribosyltransferase